MNPILRFAKSRLRPYKERRNRAPAEVVIVSFPKSGRTWLRLMIGKALCDRYGLPGELMLDTLELTRRAGLPPTTFCHDGGSNMEGRHLDRLVRHKESYRDKKVLLLARDPRDVVTSCYFQATRRRDLFRGSISDFVRDPRYGIRKILTWYRIWEQNRDVPRAFAVIRYEDLRRDPEKGLREALEFIGMPDPDEQTVRDAVDYARFENMRKLERQETFQSGILRPKRSGSDEALKTRRGVVGGYVDHLGPDDVAYCEAALAELGSSLATGSREAGA